MDYNNQNPITPNPSSVPGMSATGGRGNHHKARWIIILIACLVILVALVTLLRTQMVPIDDSTLTEEEKLIQSMTANGGSNIDRTQSEAIIKASTAQSEGKMTDAERAALVGSMSAQ